MPGDLLKYHQWCISDPVLMPAYRNAIRKTVRPGDIVLDLGAGTGILSLIACEAGASRVYAVEPTEIIALIPQLAADNGFADRVIPRKCESFDLELPERADVMIASMFGSAGIGNNMLKVVVDARERLLKPGGAIIPQAIQPSFCPVELPEWYKARIECWDAERMGFSYHSVRAVAVNRLGSCLIDKGTLLAGPQTFPQIPLSTFASPNVGATLDFRIERSGTVHGLAGWIEITTAEGIRCGDSPLDSRRMPWDQLILPLESPVSVQVGDRLQTTVRTSSVAKDTIMLWDVWFRNAAGSLRAEFHHSSFQGLLIAKEDLVSVVRDFATVEHNGAKR